MKPRSTINLIDTRYFQHRMELKTCRICCERQASVDIYESKENDLEIFKKLMYCCVSLKFEANDGLPAHICISCENELQKSYEFVLKCEESDKKLRYLLPNPIENAWVLPCDTKSEVKTELNNLEDNSSHGDDFYVTYEDIKLETKPKLEPSHEITPKVKRKKRKCVRNNFKKEQIICSVCGRKCISSSALSAHMRMHTDVKPFHCTSCDKKYKDSGSLKRHIDRNHTENRERKFMCETCGKGFFSKNDIKIHLRVHTGETPYSCSVCPQRFTQLSAMLRHMNRHTGQKSHVCPTCNKSFWTKEELKKHDSVHNNIRQFSCSFCNVKFKYKSNIKKHMRMHLESNRFVCNYCGQMFNLKGNLKIHIDRKHSEKSGYCGTCSKHVSNMEAHMWRHTGQRPLKCDFCTSSFYELKALARHINFKHKKTDRYKCTVEGCHLSFPSKPMVVFHVAKYHEMQTLYSCKRCPRGFYRKNDLSRHMMGTHKEKLLF